MKMFGNLSTENAEKAGDRIGGGRELFETDAYEAVVTMAYVVKSQSQGSNAQGINLQLDIGGKELSPRPIYITNRNGENFYERDGKKFLLPGFEQIDELCLVTTGEGLADQDIEEKVVEIYNFDEQKMVPTNVPVLTGLLGQKVIVCVLKQNVDKQQKDSSGNYVNTGETRDENEIDKFVHLETRKTVTEAREGIEEPIFLDKWIERNKGKTRNKAKGAEGKSGAPGRAGANSSGAPTAGAGKPKSSLFGK